ncbi:MAG TPA: response regulator transcription factor [Flavobacteriaceae bacterium]|nr:response regulator transcription factor [Flavobacteriaceae bacterium]
MITIAIAEDHQSLIDGIELLLKYEQNYEVVGVANDGERLLDIVRLKQPKVVLTDIKMPKIDGIAAVKIIKKEFPHTKIIAFTMFDQEDAVRQMVDAGADGYLLKNSELKEIITAIENVINGKQHFDSNIENFTSGNGSSESKSAKHVLSKTEREIFKLIQQGKTSREIAEFRFCSVSTIDTHRKNMCRKLGLHGGPQELYKYAIESKYNFE